MCGIHGILNFKREKLDYDKFLSGLCSIQHRGPDDFGFVLINTISKEQKQKESNMTDKNANAGNQFDLNVLGNFGLSMPLLNKRFLARYQMMFNDTGLLYIFNGEILKQRTWGNFP